LQSPPKKKKRTIKNWGLGRNGDEVYETGSRYGMSQDWGKTRWSVRIRRGQDCRNRRSEEAGVKKTGQP